MAEFLLKAQQTFVIILRAYPMTLLLSALGGVFALLLGFVVALCKHSRLWPLKVLGTLYINVSRNIPYIIMIFLVFYGVPMFFDWQVSALFIAILSLSLNQAAYFGEIIRGGLAKQQHGQIEAAEALGLSFLQRLHYIVVPQVLYAVAPALMG